MEKKINRQLFVRKFMSSRLKKFDYKIESNYESSLINEDIIALSDNQILRTIRDVIYEFEPNNKKRILDLEELEVLYSNEKKIKRQKKSDENTIILKNNRQKIIDMCYHPEYITIVIEHNTHYDKLFEDGLIIVENGIEVLYRRLSSSAGQARNKTVVFCSCKEYKKEDGTITTLLDEVNKRLDNGRDKNIKFSPSKFNAYKGLYGSATKNPITEPRFCVVKDYESPTTFKVNNVLETEIGRDDIITEKVITKNFNRWDGMGIISPELANKWSEEIGLDYTPAQFCIRQSFLKGMVCVFDFKEFCKEKNNGNYLIDTIYKDNNGNYIKVDLREIDLIITESQFKLWASYKSLDDYIYNYKKNNLKWGISLVTPKESEVKNILKLNYQFIQTLNISKEDIPKLCEKFVNWIKGVNGNDRSYMLLFLLGLNNTEESINEFFEKQGNEWIKALIINEELIYDKFISDKIYKLIRKTIERAYIGDIIVDGNFQVLVSDPYAMMEYLCGQEVRGLLGEGEYYSSYWNRRDVKVIDSMRAPLTYRSEHVKLNLKKNEETEKWYKYCYVGIILNVHGCETDRYAGSDFDMDILATTKNDIMINGIYKNELVVVYEAPKPEKIIFNDQDLYNSDKFSFGSIIGSITNKSTSAMALLPILEEKYGIDSEEYKTTINRCKMCTKLQSAQIDKAKIGREVKGIPKLWVDKEYIKNNFIGEEKQRYIDLMLNKHPYFFRYLYSDTNKKYKQFLEGYDITCMQKFGMSLKELLHKENRTIREEEYIIQYYEHNPVIDSQSVMNNLCHYLEGISFRVRNNIEKKSPENIAKILSRNEYIENEETYKKVLEQYKSCMKELKESNTIVSKVRVNNNKFSEVKQSNMRNILIKFKKDMEDICSNEGELVDYLIRIFYVDKATSNKEILWSVYGGQIVNNLLDKKQTDIYFPYPDEDGSIEYLGDKFTLKKVVFKGE